MHGGRWDGDARFYRDSVLNIHGGETGGVRGYGGSTFNIYDGVLYSADMVDDAVINIMGGVIQYVSTGSGRINVSGGTVSGGLDVADIGGLVEFTGGRHTDNISIRAGGKMTVRGGDIRINGVLAAGLINPGDSISINFDEDTILSGVFPDGTPFVYSGVEEDIQTAITVIQSDLPAIGPSLIQVPNDPIPQGIRNGQILVLNDGGVLPNNYTAGEGSTLLVNGGSVGHNFEAIGANVNLTGGQLNTIDAFPGTLLNMSGETEWSGMDIYRGAVANFSGGTYTGGHIFRAHPGATLNIFGGNFIGVFEAEDAVVNIAGGSISTYRQTSTAYGASQITVSDGFLDGFHLLGNSTLLVTGGHTTKLTAFDNTLVQIYNGKIDEISVRENANVMVNSALLDVTHISDGNLQILGGTLGDTHNWHGGSVNLAGYDFQIDGVPISGLDTEGQTIPFNYPPGSMLTGVFSDGTPFNIVAGDNFQNVHIVDGVLNLTRSAIPTLPSIITIPSDPVPYGAAPGQTVILNSGGQLGDNFVAAQNTIIQINNGTVGKNFEADRSEVSISGGTIGEDMDVFSGAVVSITGGSIERGAEIHSGGILNIQGGSIYSAQVYGGNVNMSDGVIQSQFHFYDGGQFTMTGGLVDRYLYIHDGSVADVSDGIIRLGLRVQDTGLANISGGEVAFGAKSGSNVDISGGHILPSSSESGSTVDVTGGRFYDGINNGAGNQFTF